MKISIGIPTIAGRERYLAAALGSCIAQTDADLEIVVSDNSGGDARDVVESFGDSRIRYIRPDRYLPMSAHWDFLVRHLAGDLVSILGDDDALMPGALQRVRELALEHPGLPIHHALANYCWPDFVEEQDRNKLWFIHEPGRRVVVRDSAEFLRGLGEARIRYIDGPMVYHNFVPGDIVRGLLLDGTMFHRASPDMYSAVTVAAHVPAYVSTQEVLTLAGQGARSNGASTRNNGTDASRFVEEMKARYAPRTATYTLQLHTLDCLLEASERYGRPDLLASIQWGEQFCAAANECLDFPGLMSLRQGRKVLAEAARHGCLGYVLRNRGIRLVVKVAGALTRRKASATPRTPYAPGVRSAVPTGVRDVHAASLHLHAMLP